MKLLWLIVVAMGWTTAATEPPRLSIHQPVSPKSSGEFVSRPPRFVTRPSTFTRALFSGTRQRLLQPQDTGFERFNELFADATLSLGNFTVEVVGNAVTLDIVNLKCNEVVIGELVTGHTVFQENGKDVLEFTVTLSPFDFNCVADYRYKLLFVPGGGSVSAITKGNSLTTKIHITSNSTFAEEPPIASVVDYCLAEIKTDGRVSFQGDFAANIANLFKQQVSNLIDDRAREAVCKEFSIFGPDFFGGVLENLNLRFDNWTMPLPEEIADPLFPERNFTAPKNVELVNFRQPRNSSEAPESIADLFIRLLKEEDALFGKSEVDPQTGASDLGINNFIRSSLLEDDRSFLLNVVELQPDFNPVIFEGQDRLTDTSLTIETIQVVGLDSLQAFDPFQDIGDYTLSNDLSWTTLAIEARLTVDIKPSSLPNSMIASPRPIRIIENITVSIDLTTLDVALSLFMAIDRTKFNDIQLGSLLTPKNILPCMISTMAGLEVSELNVTVGDFSVPLLNGFISPGIDLTVSNIVKAIFDAYKPTMLRAMPGIFQTMVRTALNGRLGKYIGHDDGKCEPLVLPPSSNERSAYVDFIELFLDPADAKSLGGRGDQPYGTLGPLAYSLVQDRLAAVGDDGLPMINELIIRPFTERQSGEAGSLVFPESLFELGDVADDRSSRRLAGSLLNGTFSLVVNNLRVENIDTIGFPMKVLSISSDPYVLENSLTMGGGQRNPMTFKLGLVSGEDETRDEIDIALFLDSVTLSADLRALLVAGSFFNFPLGDLLEFNCWLASFKSVQLDQDGFALDPTADRGLSLTKIATTISGFSLNATCVECNSPGSTLLPELQQIIQTAGAISTLGDRLPELLDSVAMSETVQTAFDRLTADSAQFCPSNPKYNENAIKTEYGMIPLPTLSATSIDTVLFSSLIAAQTGFVIFAENQRVKGIVDTDPLSFQRNFTAPDNVRLLDWTNIGNSSGLGGIADKVFGQVRKFLGGNETKFFNAEELLDKILDENGAIELNPDLSFSRGDVLFKVQSVRVAGLDSFAVLDIFEPVAPQTLVSAAEFANLDIRLELSLDSPSTSEPPQVMTVSFNVQDVSANIGLFAAFDLNTIGKLELGSLLNTKTMFRCILSAAIAFEITELAVAVGSFSTPTVEGLLADTGSAATATLNATFTRYKTEITEAIPAIFNGVLRETLTTLLVPSDERTCSAASISSTSYIDFRDLILPAEKSRELGGSGMSPYGDIISTAFTYLRNEWFVSKSGGRLARINEEFIQSFTESQSGTSGRFFFEGDIFNQGQSLEQGGIDATVRIRLYDFFVNNLDTIGSPAVLLDPIDGKSNDVNNSVAIGIDRRLEIGVHVTLELKGSGTWLGPFAKYCLTLLPETDISNDMILSVNLENMEVLMVALAKMSERAFMSFPIEGSYRSAIRRGTYKYFPDMSKLQCWLATIPAPILDQRGVTTKEKDHSLAVQEFSAAVSDAGLNVTCKKCTGPKFAELSELLSSIESSEDVTRSANSLLALLRKVVSGKFLQVVVDRALNDAPHLCPHNAAYDPNYERIEFDSFDVKTPKSSIAFFVAILIVGCAMLLAAGLILVALKLFVLRRHRKWAASLNPQQIKRLRDTQMQQDSTETALNDETKSMFRSSGDIPLFWRASMPFIIVGNIGFFVSGHVSLGGVISILVSLGGQTFQENSFFEFSMAESTADLWTAGARELAILIFIFSFLWPYTKQLITLGLWFASPAKVSVSKRGSILLWLDFFAKWSIIDVFVLIVTIVTFRISIQSPKLSFLPADFYSVDLLVIPKWGLYANMTAQIISQLSSHVIIHYHRRIIENAMRRLVTGKQIQHATTTPTDDDVSDEKPTLEKDEPAMLESERPKVLYQHAFYRAHRGESEKLVVKKFVNPVLLASSIFTCGLVTTGCFVPSYSLDILGLVGILVESGQDFQRASKEFSVLSTLGVLFGQANITGGVADYIGLGSLSVLLVFSVLVVPVLQLGALLVQWFVPLNPRRRHRLSVALEIFQAWQYAEVYLLSLLVGAWQLGPVSEFTINPYCAPLQRIFAELNYYGLLKEVDAQCLRTNVNVESTFYVLFIGTIFLAIINTFVMKAVDQFIRDQDPRILVDGGANMVSDLNEFTDYETSDGEKSSETIKPVPVQFTDRFRWLLCREDTMLGQRSNSYEDSYPEVQEHPVDEGIEKPAQREEDFDIESSDSLLRRKFSSFDDSVLMVRELPIDHVQIRDQYDIESVGN